MFLVELRRSPMRWVAPLLLVMQVGMMFTRTTEWIGQWSQTSAVVQVGAFLCAAVASASAAWSAGRWIRADGDLVQPRGPRVLLASGYPLLAGIVWVLSSYLGGAVIGAATTWRSADAPDGFLWPNYLLLGAALLVLGCALGHLLGLVVPGPAAPPIAAILTTLLAYTWTVPVDGGGTESALLVVTGPAAVTLSATALAARWLVVLLLVALAVVWTPVGLRRAGSRKGPSSLVVPLVVAALLAARAVGQAGPLVVPRSPPQPPKCAGNTVIVCVWPEDAKYLQPTVEMAQRVHDASAAYGFRLPTKIYQRGLGPRPNEGFMVNAGQWMIADWLGVFAVARTVPQCAKEDETAQKHYFAALENLISFATSIAYGAAQPASIHSTSESAQLPAPSEATPWVKQQREAANSACR